MRKPAEIAHQGVKKPQIAPVMQRVGMVRGQTIKYLRLHAPLKHLAKMRLEQWKVKRSSKFIKKPSTD